MGFDAARRAALVGDLLGLLKGRPAELLPFDQVRRSLHLRHLVDRGRQEVPLELIVGSLGRSAEFNRAFLPLKETLRERWSEVESLARGTTGFPAVELYQVGAAYFVVDGHHRVSVASSLGSPTIEAHVMEYLTQVPLSSDDSVDAVLLKSGLADFLEATGMEPVEPGEYLLTEPAGYQRLLEHIAVHAYYRGVETGHEVSFSEAVLSWRETVYRPMVDVIRASGIMEEFEGRTETDLYLFAMDHLHHLRERYGRQVGPMAAVRHLRLFLRPERPLAERLRAWLARLIRRGAEYTRPSGGPE